AIHLACAPKSNAAYKAIGRAQELVRTTGDLPVPLHLRNAPTGLMKDLGYGRDYQYSHAGAGNFVEQEFLPQPLSGTRIYEPGDNAREANHAALIARLWGDRYQK